MAITVKKYVGIISSVNQVSGNSSQGGGSSSVGDGVPPTRRIDTDGIILTGGGSLEQDRTISPSTLLSTTVSDFIELGFPRWDMQETYNLNSFVYYLDNRTVYRSKQESNKGNVPNTTPAWWEEVSFGGESSLEVEGGTGITVVTSDSTATVSLDAGAQAALSKADTAVQPSDLGSLAKKDKVTINDIDTDGSPSSSNFLRGDGTWKEIADIVGPEGPQGNPAPISSLTITTFSTPGTFDWTIPAGVTKIRCRVWGAGGRSGKGSAGLLTSATGSDGGGGGYAEAILNLPPLEIITVVVGDGSSPYLTLSYLAYYGTQIVIANGGEKGSDSTGGNAATGIASGGFAEVNDIAPPNSVIPILRVSGSPGRSGLATDALNATLTGAGFGFSGMSTYYASGAYVGKASTTVSVGGEGSAGKTGDIDNPGRAGGNGLVILEYFS